MNFHLTSRILTLAGVASILHAGLAGARIKDGGKRLPHQMDESRPSVTLVSAVEEWLTLMRCVEG